MVDRRKLSNLAKLLKLSLTNEIAWELYSDAFHQCCVRHLASGHVLCVSSKEKLDFPGAECLSDEDREYIWPEAKALKEHLEAIDIAERKPRKEREKRSHRSRIFKNMTIYGLGLGR